MISYIIMWRFPEMVVPLNHPFEKKTIKHIINQPAIRDPPLWKHDISIIVENDNDSMIPLNYPLWKPPYI